MCQDLIKYRQSLSFIPTDPLIILDSMCMIKFVFYFIVNELTDLGIVCTIKFLHK